MRPKFIAGNWKMYTTAATARKLADAVVAGPRRRDARAGRRLSAVPVSRARRARCCAAVGDAGGAELLPRKGRGVHRRGQPGHAARTSAASTSSSATANAGTSSARRDAFINRKVHAALAAGLQVILCLGETLEEREADRTEAVLERQLDGSLAGLDAAAPATLVLAYEPVWAIGTGHNATPEQAQQAHAFIRGESRHCSARKRPAGFLYSTAAASSRTTPPRCCTSPTWTAA